MDALLLPALGGTIIGLAAVTLMALNGRIAGISGILNGLLPPSSASDTGWRLAFLLGLVVGPLLVTLALGRDTIGVPVASPPVLAIAGLLVGIGTTMGGGCTSGHGVCGIARLSPRSLVATATFILAGMVTVLMTRHLF